MTNTKTYPIFISYRRKDTADKAEHLMSLLESSGFRGRVSFDKDNLDGRFDLEILKRLDGCTDFIALLGAGTLDGLTEDDSHWYKRLSVCSVEEFSSIEDEMKHDGGCLDYVRLEIARAIAKGKHIIPIVPSSTSEYDFDKLQLPSDIHLLVKQHAEKFQDSKDFLFRDILPKVVRRLITPPDRHWRLVAFIIICVISSVVALLFFQDYSQFENCRTQEDYQSFMAGTPVFFRVRCSDTLAAFNNIKGSGYSAINDSSAPSGRNDSVKVQWGDECSLLQIRTIKRIINNMVLVRGGTFLMGTDNPVGNEEEPRSVIVEDFYIGKFEVSEYEWNVVMKDSPEGEPDLPMSGISWRDCDAFVKKLGRLTKKLLFAIPTEVQWEYAARWGEMEGWQYAGGEKPEELATFSENSDDRPTGRGLHSPTKLELYDMSGNVSEWCDDGDEIKKPLRGGSYASDREMITTTFCDSASPDFSSPQIGVRLVLTL